MAHGLRHHTNRRPTHVKVYIRSIYSITRVFPNFVSLSYGNLMVILWLSYGNGGYTPRPPFEGGEN